MAMATSLLCVRRTSFGPGKISEISQELKWHNSNKVAIITDKGIVKAGVLDKIREELDKAEIESLAFTDVMPEPSIEIVDEGVDFLSRANCDSVIGVGGGSSMDCAKAITCVYDSGGSARNYVGVGLVKKRLTPLIQIPTTAGTGSEVTLGAIFAVPEEKRKIGIVSPFMMADSVIVDPELTYSMPQFVTACTGLDALLHAVESYFSVNSNELTDMYALRSIEIICSNLIEAYSTGNKQARNMMSLGSYLSGVSMANAGGAAIHSFGYPVSGTHHEAHGLVNSIFFLPILKRNIPLCLFKAKRMLQAMGVDISFLSDAEISERLLEKCNDLMEKINLKKCLKDINVDESELHFFAKNVLKETRLLKNNPFVFDEEKALEVYKEVF